MRLQKTKNKRSDQRECVTKKIPLRKCIVTGERKPKGELLRIAYSKDGVLTIDPSGKAPGRGFYIIIDSKVAEKAKKEE